MLRRTLTVAVLLAIAVTPAAAAAPGALDQGFGSGGAVLGQKGYLTAAALDGDGLILTAGIAQTYSSGPILVRRWTVAGAPDATFGALGAASVSRPGSMAGAAAVLPGPGGSVYVGGGGQGGPFVARLNHAGTLDPGFGVGGVVELAPASGGSVWGLADTPTGLVVAFAPYGAVPARLVRLRADGSPDPMFGAGGAAFTTFDPATLPATGSSGQQALVRRADGTLLLGGIRDGKPAIAAFTDAGGPLSSYGDAGVAALPRGDAYGPVTAIAPQPSGAVLALVAGSVARLDANGVLDPSFGDGGSRSLLLTTSGEGVLTSLAPEEDGGVLVAGGITATPPPPTVPAMTPTSGAYVSTSSPNPITPEWGVVLTRLTPSGAVDCRYGAFGRTRILPDGTFEATAQALVRDGAGRALTAGTARGPDYNPIMLLTRTLDGPGDEPELAAPRVQLGEMFGPYAREPVVDGWIDPRCGNLSWHFEYGRTVAYGSSTPAQPLAAGGGIAFVSRTLAGLGAGTYHYRLVTDGVAGRTETGDASFTIAVAGAKPGGDAPDGPAPTSRSGRLRLLGSRATLRSGRTARFAVRCRDGACKRGTVTLRRGRTTIATGAVSLASGKKGYVTITLTAAGRRAARRHPTLTATALLAVTGGTSSRAAVTLRSRASR